MALPLQSFRAATPLLTHPRSSLGSDTSSIISSAEGNRAESEDGINNSEHLVDDEETFFKENDPLSSEYSPVLEKSVIPLRRQWLITEIPRS